ncbi:unnamed protein product [Rhizoctonia solani]|uniref:Uncharacterized protein n=1 Tax=Rhizoctonia solani TaxID=456999 RepID=A0A8H3GLJ7_9AGAM|nr:unnamed protein product [Rhizoctonia solani]CAE6525969.1 unnamed protein product [Rhizoctonia solani]
MSQVNMDELVASLKHSHIGNEARELSALHAQLSKALLQFPHFPQTPIPSSPVSSHAPLGGFAPPTTPTHGRTQYFDQAPQVGHYQYTTSSSPEMQSHSLSPSPPGDSYATADPFYAAQQAQLNSWPRSIAAQRR